MKFLFFIVIFYSFVNTFPATKTDSTNIAATVGNYEITFASYLARYEDYLIWTGLQDNMQARFAILNNMINEILLRKYDNNTEVYNNPEYKKEISWAKDEAVLAFLKDREIYAHITASDEELKEAYVRSKTKIAVQHLFVRTLSEADSLYKLVKIGVSFKELAKQTFTDSVLRNNGGYLGYINWGETDPDFENAAYSMKVGEISKPIKTAEGYSIIKVDDIIQDPFKTEDEFLRMKKKLVRAVRISKMNSAVESYLNKVFDKNKVKFNDNALASVLDDMKGTKYGDIDLELNNKNNKVYKDCVSYKNRIYSQKEIEEKLFEVPKYNRKLLKNIKDVKEAVLGLIMHNVLLKIAYEKGYDTTSYVKETYEKLADNIYLNYKRQEVLSEVPISDSEIVNYYHENIGYFTSEKKMNVQEIVVNTDSLAEALKAKIDNSEEFGKLARKYSLKKWTADNNGVMGLSPISDFGDLKDTLWDSPLGKVLGPVKFNKYYGLFRVLDKKDGLPIDINLVKAQIIKAIKNDKGFPYMKARLDKLSKETTIKVNDDLIKNYNMNIAGK